ncbi:HupE / UreJ protein [Congregibacter litoralis KT71]|uniref:HupE / UreJ protein n=2 Tax=Congregibacter TaxID=393661 RepID=A4A7G8_9GAMM|nr:HupE / UreJ protein [Congregibacter litoralis KT71]
MPTFFVMPQALLFEPQALLPKPGTLARGLMVLCFLLLSQGAAADIFRPAYLELSQLDAERYEVLWRVPALPDNRRLAARLVFPKNTERVGESRSAIINNAWEERYEIKAAGGLTDQEITIDGILGGATDVIVRIERLDGTTQLERLQPAEPRFTVTASPGPGEVALAYFLLGVEHILGGIDHLLFVLALLLLVSNLRRLVLTITAFTVAHSITLVCATLGWIRLPGPPVEAVIALSIVFVAAEVIHEQQGRASITARSPWIVAFGFGLLHGLGFAGALQEIGLPDTAIPVALLMFNVGVEAGQLLFVGGVVISATLLSRVAQVPSALVKRVVSYGIGSIAAFWTIERVAAFIP